MSHAFVNPAELHDPAPFGYSHSVGVPGTTDIVLIAGQYASGDDGAVVSTDFAAQVRQSLHNLGVALAAHGLDFGGVVQLRTYVVDLGVDKLGPIGAAMHERWGANPPLNTMIGVAGLAMPDIRFEIEAVACQQ